MQPAQFGHAFGPAKQEHVSLGMACLIYNGKPSLLGMARFLMAEEKCRMTAAPLTLASSVLSQ